ncbi:hypothetical protein [Candidatus Anaplasma sp. TIGMIC]|uniref:hypothetical protein n=1 Tax=Candidatus Anaplasma sp. TIGMIC TaxID=3020713 RepID=UPI00232DDD94|nr:hypothetical protein [Candidatus Anaplasma sp. TIGMIC]MDB1135282.1 hypothetical protein [Candidatus Anaplasma sp. TIGMIC]
MEPSVENVGLVPDHVYLLKHQESGFCGAICAGKPPQVVGALLLDELCCGAAAASKMLPIG